MRDLKPAVAAFVVSVLLFLFVIAAGAYIIVSRSDDLQAFSGELRDGLVASCQQNGNPLREAVRDQIQEQIRQRNTLDFSRFFPNVPPEELEALLAAQTRADRKTLREIAPVDCATQYPRP